LQRMRLTIWLKENCSSFWNQLKKKKTEITPILTAITTIYKTATTVDPAPFPRIPVDVPESPNRIPKAIILHTQTPVSAAF